ncbi:MAG: hypothetical protein AMXMBFR84_06780 [Candidatus Hydrogenedentota bacterium]
MEKLRAIRVWHWIWAVLVACTASVSYADGYGPIPLTEDAYKILKATYDYDPEIPLDARLVEVKETESTTLRKIVFRGVRGFLVPARLEIPKGTPTPVPCVVLTHGWSGSKENWWEDDNYISGGNMRKALLEKGFAVFAIDAQGHGERMAENGYGMVNAYDGPEAPKRKNLFTLREIITQTALDVRRGLDYLDSRDDIDMDRIGISGYSMGGFHAVVITAMDPRIKVSVGCVIPVTWREDPILDPGFYAKGIGTRPFFMAFGSEDTMCDGTDAKALFGMLEGTDNRLVVIDAGHRLPATYVPDAVDFIASRI